MSSQIQARCQPCTWSAWCTSCGRRTRRMCNWCSRDSHQVGGERNRKQRIPVNSITSKLVLKSIYASGSTGPFFADHYLNRLNRLNSSFAKKTDFLSRYLVLSEIRYARKRNLSKQERNLLSKVFNLFEIFEITEQEDLLHSLLSA